MQWRFLNTGFSSPAWNMAVDEAIMMAHAEGRVPPTVRFYGWTPAALSIGYFQQVHRDVDVERIRELGLGLVRRATGGRAVLHDAELTYSVVVSERHMPRSVVESYQVLSLGLMEGFRQLGLKAEWATPSGKGGEMSGSAACFDSPSWYELVVEGRKISGSAQLRKRGVILQHGSILLDLDVELLFQLLRFPTERHRQHMKQLFVQRAVAINQLSSRTVTWEEARLAFHQGFAQALGAEGQEGELSAYETELARQLAAKYADHNWTFRR